MPGKRTRARARGARTEREITEFNRARDQPERFKDVLRSIAASPTPLWPFAELAASRGKPLEPEERVMIQEAVAPHLVRMTPGTVRLGNEVKEEKLHLKRLKREGRLAKVSSLRSHIPRTETGDRKELRP